MGRLSFTTTVKVKQTVNVKRTLKLTGAGFAIAGLIVGMFVFTGDITQSTDVKAGVTVKTDTLITAPNVNRGDSLVNNHSNQSGIHSEDSNHILTEKDIVQKKTKRKTTNGGNRNAEFHDVIAMPKQTSGVFEVNYEVPSEQSGTTKMELVNRKGEVVETRIPTTQSGLISEVFTLDNSIPEGVYLMKIHVGKNLFVRQVVYKRA